MRSFQYKILRNILFLNKKLYLFGITKSPLCSYCNAYDETPIHLFCECNSTKYLWLQLSRHFRSDLKFPVLTPQAAILGLFNDSVSKIHPINHILLLFELYVYKSWNKHLLNINELLANILSIKKLEKMTAFGNAKKQLLITKNGILKTENFCYRVRLGLQRVLNLQTKGVGGWFYFWKLWIWFPKTTTFLLIYLFYSLLTFFYFTYLLFYLLVDNFIFLLLLFSSFLISSH